MKEMSVPSATAIAWRVTHKTTGEFIVVVAQQWIIARDAGSRILGCDRYEVTCQRDKEGQ